MKRVTLFTKPGCHLCQTVAAEIEKLRQRMVFELEVRNILEDDEDFSKYELDIPVVHVDGVEIARHRMSAQQLETALAQ
jgi:hypothetical protein